DGSLWSVNPDWEAAEGLKNDIFAISTSEGEDKVAEQFADDSYFAGIVEQLLKPEGAGAKNRDERCAQHRAEGFMIEGGKLWRVGGKGAKGAPKVECVHSKNGKTIAGKAHEDSGHFGRDHTKIKLK
ncbi:hypothetical protein BOTBODRAFT_114346, partial [Botryobasidium botryosum FD-172 SS1]